MSNPKISIILLNDNDGDSIHKCLNSVINQTLKEIEIICIHYKSIDKSLKIVNKFKEKDARIKVFYQKKINMNNVITFGISKSNGEYVIFLNGNDWLERDACEKLYNQSNKFNTDIIIFNAIEYLKDNEIKEQTYFINNSSKNKNTFTFDYTSKKDIILNKMPFIWSKFYKNSFLKEKADILQETCDEILLHISTAISAKKIGYMPNNFYHYDGLKQTTLQNNSDNINPSIGIIETFYKIEDFLKKINKFDEIKNNFIRFVINESRDNLKKIDYKYKSSLFKEIYQYFIDIDIDSRNLKEIPQQDYEFYINVINSNNFNQLNNFEHPPKIELDDYEKILFNTINEKNDEIYTLKKQMNELVSNYDILNSFYEDYLSGSELILNSYKKIKEKNLFDEDYYRYHEGYTGNIDPYLHYIYKGYKEGKNPSKLFNSRFYIKTYENINMNPLIHFINYGILEGNTQIRPEIHYPQGLNKIKIDNELSKYNSNGVTETKRKPQLIVSLTSYPKRINRIKYALFSLLTQSLKPDKIILWLSDAEFTNKEKDIPQDVLNLKRYGVEIDWCEDIKSYKKLIPSLKKYPNDIIVTIDDDIYLEKDWLEKLYEFHIKYPQHIICHRARKITFDENNHLTPYKKWGIIKKESDASFLNFFTGAGGILYPPNSLDKEVFNKELFMRLAPTGDDIWFWAMAIKKDTKIKVVKDNMYLLNYISPEEEYNLFGDAETLWLKNSKGMNDIHMKNILEKFPEVFNKIKKE